MDSDSNGENYMLASVPLRHMVESWGKPDTGVTFKTENAEVESFTPAAPSRPATDEEHVPYLTESQMMDRIRQQRFTQDELDVLVREIQARYHRIYGKGLPFAEIRQAWEEVAAAVNNAGFGPTRTASGCQRRFRDLKRRAKMKLVNRASTKPSQRAENGPAGKDTQSCSETATPATSPSERPVAGTADGGNGGASLHPFALFNTMDVPSQDPLGTVGGPSQDPSSTVGVPSQSREPLEVRQRSLEMLQREFKPQSRNHFTKEQMDILLREIKARYHRLFGDRQHPPRFSDRRQAWEEVAAAINRARCGPTKSASACCKRLSDLKRRRKMRMGKHIVSMCQEGPIITAAFSHASPMGMNILPSVSMQLLQSPENAPTDAAEPEPATTPTPAPAPPPTQKPAPFPALANETAPTPTPAPATAPAPTLTTTPAPTRAPILTPIPTLTHIPTLEPILTLALAPAPTFAPTLTLPLTLPSTVTQTAPDPTPATTPTLAPSPAAPALTPVSTLTPVPTLEPTLTRTPTPSESPVAGANSGTAGVSVSPPAASSTTGAPCPSRRRWEQELLEVQREGLEVLQREVGALRRGLDTRLRRMESRTYPLLLSISRSLERIANATERNSTPDATTPLHTDTPPRTPRGRAVVERPATSQTRASSKGRAAGTCKRKRGRRA